MDFDFDEAKVIVDENNQTVDIKHKMTMPIILSRVHALCSSCFRAFLLDRSAVCLQDTHDPDPEDGSPE